MSTLHLALTNRFRTPELIQYMTTFTEVCKRRDPKTLLLEDRIQTLDETVIELAKSYNDNKVATLNAELKPKDKKRIKTLRGLKKFILAELDREHPDRVQYADILLKSLMQFCKGVEAFSLQHKTMVINNMLKEWEKNTKLATAINNLSANSWVEELTSQNAVFYSNYFDKAISTEPVEDTSKLKAKLKEIYTDLVTDINSFARVSPDKNLYIPLVNELNSLIEENNQPIIFRGARKKKDAVVEETPTTMPIPFISG